MSYNPNKSKEQREQEDLDISDQDNINNTPPEITPEDIEQRRKITNPLVEMKTEDNLRNINYTKEERQSEYPLIKAGQFTVNEDFNEVNKIIQVDPLPETKQQKRVVNFCPQCGYNLQL